MSETNKKKFPDKISNKIFAAGAIGAGGNGYPLLSRNHPGWGKTLHEKGDTINNNFLWTVFSLGPLDFFIDEIKNISRTFRPTMFYKYRDNRVIQNYEEYKESLIELIYSYDEIKTLGKLFMRLKIVYEKIQNTRKFNYLTFVIGKILNIIMNYIYKIISRIVENLIRFTTIEYIKLGHRKLNISEYKNIFKKKLDKEILEKEYYNSNKEDLETEYSGLEELFRFLNSKFIDDKGNALPVKDYENFYQEYNFDKDLVSLFPKNEIYLNIDNEFLPKEKLDVNIDARQNKSKSSSSSKQNTEQEGYIASIFRSISQYLPEGYRIGYGKKTKKRPTKKKRGNKKKSKHKKIKRKKK